jgi:hydrogenase maturation protease
LVPRDVTILEHDGEPAGLLDAWEGSDEAFVVDSVRGADAGTVHRVQVTSDHQHFDADGHERDSTHALGLGDAVELGRVLDRLPPVLNIIGIEGVDFSMGEGVSPAVERATVEVADELARQLKAGA